MTDRGPVFCDVRDSATRAQHKAVSCPDKILTAFCQLGALRMRARRALIFFFDINHAYVMAEATKTLSLEDDATHEPGDQLWSKSPHHLFTLTRANTGFITDAIFFGGLSKAAINCL
jgi:hypothetical protein